MVILQEPALYRSLLPTSMSSGRLGADDMDQVHKPKSSAPRFEAEASFVHGGKKTKKKDLSSLDNKGMASSSFIANATRTSSGRGRSPGGAAAVVPPRGRLPHTQRDVEEDYYARLAYGRAPDRYLSKAEEEQLIMMQRGWGASQQQHQHRQHSHHQHHTTSDPPFLLRRTYEERPRTGGDDSGDNPTRRGETESEMCCSRTSHRAVQLASDRGSRPGAVFLDGRRELGAERGLAYEEGKAGERPARPQFVLSDMDAMERIRGGRPRPPAADHHGQPYDASLVLQQQHRNDELASSILHGRRGGAANAPRILATPHASTQDPYGVLPPPSFLEAGLLHPSTRGTHTALFSASLQQARLAAEVDFLRAAARVAAVRGTLSAIAGGVDPRAAAIAGRGPPFLLGADSGEEERERRQRASIPRLTPQQEYELVAASGYYSDRQQVTRGVAAAAGREHRCLPSPPASAPLPVLVAPKEEEDRLSDRWKAAVDRLVDQYSAGGTKEAPFPIKLHLILSKDAYQDYISWLPGGKSWKIKKQYEFERDVIPRHFRHSKYSSFMRQVNGWGFQRSQDKEKTSSVYMHAHFIRDSPEKCLSMVRIGASKNCAGAFVGTHPKKSLEEIKSFQEEEEEVRRLLEKKKKKVVPSIEEIKEEEELKGLLSKKKRKVGSPKGEDDDNDNISDSSSSSDDEIVMRSNKKLKKKDERLHGENE